MEDNKQKNEGQPTQQADNTNQQGQQNQQGQNVDNNTGTDDSNVKAMSALAYFGIFFFLPLVVTPESPEGKFHANQGLVLLITGVIINVVAIIPILGWLIWLIGTPIVVVLAIIGIVNALNGRQKRLPMIGGFDLLK